MDPLLSVAGLCKAFELKKTALRIEVLDSISFSVPAKTITAIIGPSGCGKTTLLHIIAGFVGADSGIVRFDGEPVTTPDVRRTVIFQEYGLFPWLTVQDNLAYGLKIRKQKREKIREVVDHYLDLVHLRQFKTCYPHELSGGMKQRVGLARALAVDPKMLLMDEPFGSLDHLTREIMQEELLGVLEQTEKSGILITHSIEEALFLSDQVVIMTARPSRIVSIVSVPFPRPRAHALKTDKKFIVLKESILAQLKEAAIKGIEEQGVRLTKQGGAIVFQGAIGKREEYYESEE